jgi:hypothetical protein
MKINNSNKPALARAHESQEGPTPATEGPQNFVLNPEPQLPRRKIAKRLHEILTDEDLDNAVSVIRRSLKAKKTYWDGVAKKMVEEPDYKIQLDAAKTVLAYREGMPVQRQVVVSEAFESLRDAIFAAKHSPEARKLIESGLLG